MRITNSMMTNSMLLNMNRNKYALNQLDLQIATGKKIQKPSDNPIVAVRALRLRTNLREITQYKSNVQDAISWMDVSENALDNVTTMLKRVRDLCNQGSNGINTASNREKITKEILELQSQIIQEGNVNYAGRYVLSGFKTDKPLAFMEDNDKHYEITQSFTFKNIEESLKIAPPVEANTGVPNAEDPKLLSTQRIRLAYTGIEGAPATLNLGVDGLGDPVDFAVTAMNSTDVGAFTPGDDEVIFLQDTGELILGKDVVARAQEVDSFSFSYEKKGFNKEDLNPEHFFTCRDVTDSLNPIQYTSVDENIEYQVGFNQRINVNVLGKNAITHDVARDLNDIYRAIEDCNAVESKIESVKSLLSTATDPTVIENLNKKMEQLEIEKIFNSEKADKLFTKALTKMDKHIANNLTQTADIGSRMNRMELTLNRLDDDKVNFTDLMSQNEDVDLAEAMIQFRSYELVYNASLMASANVLQKSLLDFIR